MGARDSQALLEAAVAVLSAMARLGHLSGEAITDHWERVAARLTGLTPEAVTDHWERVSARDSQLVAEALYVPPQSQVNVSGGGAEVTLSPEQTTIPVYETQAFGEVTLSPEQTTIPVYETQASVESVGTHDPPGFVGSLIVERLYREPLLTANFTGAAVEAVSTHEGASRTTEAYLEAITRAAALARGSAAYAEVIIASYVGVPPHPPASLSPSEVGPTSFIANWEEVPDTNTYLLDVSTDPLFTTYVTGYEHLDVGQVTSYRVTGLEPGVTYYYRVYAANPPDQTDPSDVQSAYTAGTYAAYYNTVRSDGPTGYWPLEELAGQGLFCHDYSGHGYHGFYNVSVSGLGAEGAIAGEAGHCVDLAPGGYAMLPPGPFPLGDAPRTIEFWMCPSEDADTTTTAFSQAQWYNHWLSCGELNFFQEPAPGGGLQLRLNLYNFDFPPATLVAGQWHHVVFTFDGIRGHLYVNSVEVSHYNFYQGQVRTQYGDVFIGVDSWLDENNQYLPGYDGRIDEVAVYDYPLSPARITAHYLHATDPGPQTIAPLPEYSGASTIPADAQGLVFVESFGPLATMTPHATGHGKWDRCSAWSGHTPYYLYGATEQSNGQHGALFRGPSYRDDGTGAFMCKYVPALSEYVAGLRVRYSSTSPTAPFSLLAFGSGEAGMQSHIVVDMPSERLLIYRGASTDPADLIAQTPLQGFDANYVEVRLKVGSTDGEVEVRCNSKMILLATGLNTEGDPSATIDRIYLGTYLLPEEGWGLIIEDFYIANTLDGGAGFREPMRVRALRVGADGASLGAETALQPPYPVPADYNWQNVSDTYNMLDAGDRTPHSFAALWQRYGCMDFSAANTAREAGQGDTYATNWNGTMVDQYPVFYYPDLGAARYFGVQSVVSAAQDEALSLDVVHTLRAADTDYYHPSAADVPALDFESATERAEGVRSVSSRIWEHSPATGQAWDASGVGSLQIGVKTQ